MKTSLSTLLCLAVVYACVQDASAQYAQFRNADVKLTLHATPLFSVSNAPNSSTPRAGRWLLIELSYTAPRISAGANIFRWLDEPSVEAEVVFPAHYNGQDVMAFLTGKVVYWSIPLDGGKHYSLLLVPPQIISRYSRPGSRLRESDVVARVSMYTRERQLLLREYNRNMSYTAEEANRMIAHLSGPVSAGLRLPDTILPRNRTPWAWIEYDRYNLIKDEIGAK